MPRHISLKEADTFATELADRMNGTDPRRQMMAYSFETYFATLVSQQLFE